jgi:DUF4097 and DUF4098 domain-containing protein YvlB
MQKSFEVSGPVELDIRLASGEISIDPSLEGRVEIDLLAHDDESQRLIDEARVELRDNQSRPQVNVLLPQKRGFSFGFGRQGVSCTVRCPQGSSVSAKTKSADLSATGTLGGLSFATASGDTDVDRIDGSINVKTASGDVQVGEVSGSVNVQSASGDVTVEAVRGPANVGSVSGDVTVEAAYDNLSANTVSGDQDLGAVMRGTVSAQSVSGDVTIGVRRGSKVFLDCNTLSGDTRSELEVSADAPAGDGPLVEIRAKTVSGDIHITRASAPAIDTTEVQA